MTKHNADEEHDNSRHFEAANSSAREGAMEGIGQLLLDEIGKLRAENARLVEENKELEKENEEVGRENDELHNELDANENEDDGEPITKAWFEETFSEVDYGVIEGTLKVVCYMGSSLDPTTPMYLEVEGMGIPLPAVRTRGDVRQLMRLLTVGGK